ncbi:hypothetical protein AO353_28700 [Pseudomonas fluorescens]|uniref:Uncharacterized protein n=1 Tax=Pseudomonas fluorescens TaxID=294 RepID=A0A0N9X2E4_PSEFL|nr:hypothetical protein AO353_28700 [Pseudomonas fluorescens]
MSTSTSASSSWEFLISNLDNDPESHDHAVTLVHLEILRNATDADSRPLLVHTVSPPLNPRKSRFSKNNPDFAPGYINYFVINGAVIAPEFGDKAADTKAFDLLSELYPDREVVNRCASPAFGRCNERRQS